MASGPRIFICGGDYRAGPRDACPDPVHDWPLPAGYVDASAVADSRLYRRWANTRCPQCGLYGWRPGRIDPETDHHVPAPGGTTWTRCVSGWPG